MSHSQRLRPGEVRRVFRLLGDLRDLKHDLKAQERCAVDGLCGLLGAPMGWASSFDNFRPGADLRMKHFVPGSVSDPRWLEHLSWWGTISEPEEDGVVVHCLPRTAAADAVRGSGFYESEADRRSYRSWEELGVPLGIRDSLATWFRLPGSDSIRGYAFQRTWDDADFSDRQVRLARLFSAELLRLHRAGRLAPPVAPAVAALPPRLHRLAPLLLTGLGQKQIAFQSGLTYQTIRSYTKELYGILGVGSREELAVVLRG